MSKYWIEPKHAKAVYDEEVEESIKKGKEDFKKQLDCFEFLVGMQAREPERKDVQDLINTRKEKILREYNWAYESNLRKACDRDDFEFWLYQGGYQRYLKRHEQYCNEQKAYYEGLFKEMGIGKKGEKVK